MRMTHRPSLRVRGNRRKSEKAPAKGVEKMKGERRSKEKRKDEGRKGREGVCARRTDPHTTRGRPRACAPCARHHPRGRGARQERETREREEIRDRRWASDEWGCRAVATNRQNQG